MEKLTKEDMLEKHCPSMNNLYLDSQGRNFRDRVVLAMQEYADQEKPKWISVEDKAPEQYQRVLFVVESNDKCYNGKTYGGTYQGFKYGYHGFSMPGIEFSGTHWMPIPEFIKEIEGE